MPRWNYYFHGCDCLTLHSKPNCNYCCGPEMCPDCDGFQSAETKLEECAQHKVLNTKEATLQQKLLNVQHEKDVLYGGANLLKGHYASSGAPTVADIKAHAQKNLDGRISAKNIELGMFEKEIHDTQKILGLIGK